MFVKCITNISLGPSPSLEIKNGKDNLIPKGVSEVAYLLTLNVDSYCGFRCKVKLQWAVSLQKKKWFSSHC